MCGLFGSVAKQGHVVDLAKMEILGLWNERRGVDSCGYYYAGNIKKGVDGFARIGDYFLKNGFVRGDLAGEVFMGHTRKATAGVHSEENAHPHTVENYVQTHNGVIRNITRLAARYNVDEKGTVVDSVILSRIIQQRGWDVLNHYAGAAALAMTYMDNSNTLYLYHGASREKAHEEVAPEERPLFVLDLPEAFYYSSIYNSLIYIARGTNVLPQIVPHNKVFKIEDGILDKTPVYIVDRDNVNIDDNSKFLLNNFYNVELNTWQPVPKKEKEKDMVLLTQPKKLVSLSDLTALLNDKQPIWFEALPPEFAEQDVYCRFGRYFKSSRTLLHGQYVLDNGGNFVVGNAIPKRPVCKYYFWRGIMMKDEKCFNAMVQEIPNAEDLTRNIGFVASKYSKYPVTCMEEEGTNMAGKYKTLWWQDGTSYGGVIRPVFASRGYVIVQGVLTQILTNTGDEFPMLPLDAPLLFPITLVDGQRVPETPIITARTEEEEMVKLMVEVVDECADKILNEYDIKNGPEQFLVVIDHIIENIVKIDDPKVRLTDKAMETETTWLLKKLVASKQTLKEYLASEKLSYLYSRSIVELIMQEYEPDSLMEMDNRYNYIDFEDVPSDFLFSSDILLPVSVNCCDIEQELNEVTGGNISAQAAVLEKADTAINQLVELEILADKLQAIEDSDEAQNLSFALYKSLEQAKKALEEITKKDAYKTLMPNLKKIKAY